MVLRLNTVTSTVFLQSPNFNVYKVVESSEDANDTIMSIFKRHLKGLPFRLTWKGMHAPIVIP